MSSTSATFWETLFFADLVAALQPGYAQAPRLRFDHLTLDDGLSHSTVETITQGPHGFLWFGTSDGLNRYDGSSVRVYRRGPWDPDDVTTISGNKGVSVMEARNGIEWAGTAVGGLNRYDLRTGGVKLKDDDDHRLDLGDTGRRLPSPSKQRDARIHDPAPE